jgi:hypothetical protein
VRTQKITKVVDALVNQQRVILWLQCHHKVSITQLQLASMPKGYLEAVTRSGEYDCPFCPDPSPEQVRENKSVNQLWREAGEP